MKSIADYFHLPVKIRDNSIHVDNLNGYSAIKNEDNDHVLQEALTSKKMEQRKMSKASTLTSQVVAGTLEQKSLEKSFSNSVGEDTEEDRDVHEEENGLYRKNHVKTKMNVRKVARRKRSAVVCEKPNSKQIKRRKCTFVVVESDTTDDDDNDDTNGNSNVVNDGRHSRKEQKNLTQVSKRQQNSYLKQKKKGVKDSSTNREKSRARLSPGAKRQHREHNLRRNISATVPSDIESTDCKSLKENNSGLIAETSRKRNAFGKLDIIITKFECSPPGIKSAVGNNSETKNEEKCKGNDVAGMACGLSNNEQKENQQKICNGTASPEEDSKKRNNLLSYFDKVSKESVNFKPDKIKVEALVHTPMSPCNGRKVSSRLKMKKMNKSKTSKCSVHAEDKIEVLASEDLVVNQNSISGGNETLQTDNIEVLESEELLANQYNICIGKTQTVCNANVIVSATIPNAQYTRDKISSPGKGWRMRIRIRDVNGDESEEAHIKGMPNIDHLPFKKNKEEGECLFVQKMPNDTCIQNTGNRLPLSSPTENTVTDAVMSCSESKSKMGTKTTDIPYQNDPEVHTCNNSENSSGQACVRLAPVFMKNKSKKHKPNADVIMARRTFLQSGVPETLKKAVELLHFAEEQEQDFPTFPAISHVQQKDSKCNVWDLPNAGLSLKADLCQFNAVDICKRWQFRELIDLEENCVNVRCIEKQIFPVAVLHKIVSNIKLSNSDLPVCRLFKNLSNKYVMGKMEGNGVESCDLTKKKKKRLRNSKSKLDREEQIKKMHDSDSNVMWCEKYKPTNSTEVISAKRSAVRLKKWLENWKLNCKDSKKHNKKIRNVTSSSDDEFKYSESGGSCDVNNAAVLLGPHGSGKTSSVYAVANELGFEVLEINSSSKRTGKRILADLQEATQSHRIGMPEVGSSQSSIMKSFRKGRGKIKSVTGRRSLKSESERQRSNLESERRSVQSGPNERKKKRKMSLILIEEVDIVFDDYDEGFVSALSTLVATSKRPVIFTATDVHCPQVVRLMEKHLVLRYDVVPSRLLNVWLQLLCLLEGVRVSNIAIRNVLQFMHYDIRKTMMHLQFWILSGGDNLPYYCVNNEDSLPLFLNNEADNSNLSWSLATDEVAFPEESLDSIGMLVNCNRSTAQTSKVPFPVDLCGVWWNLATLLDMPQVNLYKHKEKSGSRNETIKKTECENFIYYDSDSSVSDKVEKKSWHCAADSSENEMPVNGDKPLPQNVSASIPNKCSHKVIHALMDVMDTLSCVDVMDFTVARSSGYSGYKEIKTNCWAQKPQDSTSLLEDQTALLNMELPTIGHWLIERSIAACRRQLNLMEHAIYSSNLPSHEAVRSISEQHSLSSAVWDIVPQSCWLSRKSMSTDYSPMLRNMSRLHNALLKTEQLATTRFRQRHFHYLKDLGTSADITTCKSLSSIFSHD